MVLVLSRGGFCPKDRLQDSFSSDRELEVAYWRPDWDITKPELRAAWEQGRKELFYLLSLQQNICPNSRRARLGRSPRKVSC
jgi:hypothetical protein